MQDPHIALMLLQMCGGFCKISHIPHTMPPSFATDEQVLHQNVINCLSECLAMMPPKAKEQAQLSLQHGGLVINHLPTTILTSAYIASPQFD